MATTRVRVVPDFTSWTSERPFGELENAMSPRKLIQTASHWGVYSVEISESGEIAGVALFVTDPNPTDLLRGLPELVRSDLRIEQPYVREGYLRRREGSANNRGGGRFVAVDWNAALDMIEEELRRVEFRFEVLLAVPSKPENVAEVTGVIARKHGPSDVLGQIGLPGHGFCLGFCATNSMSAPRIEQVPRPT